jgi:hypothetical protein
VAAHGVLAASRSEGGHALTSTTLAAVSILALAAPALALITITHCPPGHYVPGW